MRVVRAKRRLGDFEIALIQGFGLGVAALRVIEQGQIIQALANIRVVRAERCLADLQAALV